MLTLRSASAFLAALAAGTLPAAAQGPELAMLDNLQKGSWTIALRSDGSERQVCIRTGREFVQLRHAQSGCSRYVVEDSARQVTVQYTCRGSGYGRTTIRMESRGLVQVSSQGIHSGTPFSLVGEARQTGAC